MTDSSKTEQAPSTRVLVIGGFLGAGKTTTILTAARRILADGGRLGIVTNDQGVDLVDTNFLAHEGFSVVDVTGGCFCCNYDEFASKLRALELSEKPDVVIAEPVGSCTDLIATIFRPLAIDPAFSLKLAPLTVLADPRRVEKLIAEERGTLPPTEINYLFRTQLDEADIIVLNKVDTLTADRRTELTGFLEKSFPGRPVMAISATTGESFDEWFSLVASGLSALDGGSEPVEYDTYAAAEAALGWLNAAGTVVFRNPTDGNAFLTAIVEDIRDRFAADQVEIAHLKAYIVSDTDAAKLSLVATDAPVEFSSRLAGPITTAALVINTRAVVGPEKLRRVVETVIEESLGVREARCDNFRVESFSPAYPRPVHRIVWGSV
ncbi:MAG: hypothetical protein EA426_14720 [Spirochaetaceae bacterium]|nr:MAG: hypothetical protein EA426_14720 [Spirochaetaceae bacterium]